MNAVRESVDMKKNVSGLSLSKTNGTYLPNALNSETISVRLNLN